MDWKGFDRAKRPECRKCPRFKTGVFVPPKIVKGGLCVMAEAPGQKEIAPADQTDREPLVGESGAILDRMLQKAGSHRQECSLVNVALCGLPGSNDDPEVETVECCAGLVTQALRDAAPKVVVAVGKYSLLRLTGKDRITKWAGSILSVRPKVVIGSAKRFVDGVVYKSGKKKGQPKPVKVDVHVDNEGLDFTVIPTLHPAAVLRSQLATAPLVIAHIKRARMLHEGAQLVEVASECDGSTSTLDALEGLLERDTLVVDVETTGEGKITLVGIAPNTQQAYVFRPSVRLFKALNEWCANPTNTFVAHNATFDMLRLHEEGVRFKCRVWDTMHAAQYDLPGLRQSTTEGGTSWNLFSGLDLVASRFPELEYYNWKEAFRQDATTDEVLYCQRDCCVEWFLYEQLRERLHRKRQLRHFEETLMPLLKVLTEMERVGVRIDKPKASRFLRTQTALIRALEKEWEHKVPGIKPTQTVALQKYFYDELGLKEQTVGRGANKRRTLNKEALEELAAKYDLEELRILTSLRHAIKVRATYLERLLGGIDENGFFHFEYNLGGANTGRLSGDAQQFPRPTPDGSCINGVEGCCCGRLRELIIGDTDNSRVIAADYSQIEAIITAILAGEEWLIEGFNSDEFDYHTTTGELLKKYIGGRFAQMSPKELRQWGKKANHATNYCMTWRGIQKHFGCTAAEAKAIERAIHDARPATVTWWQQVKADVLRKGYVSNPWGRRLYMTPKRNWKGEWDVDLAKVVAFIPQSSAFEVIAGAMIRAHEAGLRLMIQAHDELVISEEHDDDAEVLRECMEYYVEELCHTFSADVGVGANWMEAKLNG